MDCHVAEVLDVTLGTTKLTIFCAVRSTLLVRLPLESHTRSVLKATRGQTKSHRFHGGEAVVWLGMLPVLTPMLSPTRRPPAVSPDQLLLEQS